MFKILLLLILLFIAGCVVAFGFIHLHKLFFKQEMHDIIEEAAEKSMRDATKKQAKKIFKK